MEGTPELDPNNDEENMDWHPQNIQPEGLGKQGSPNKDNISEGGVEQIETEASEQGRGFIRDFVEKHKLSAALGVAALGIVSSAIFPESAMAAKMDIDNGSYDVAATQVYLNKNPDSQALSHQEDVQTVQRNLNNIDSKEYNQLQTLALMGNTSARQELDDLYNATPDMPIKNTAGTTSETETKTADRQSDMLLWSIIAGSAAVRLLMTGREI